MAGHFVLRRRLPDLLHIHLLIKAATFPLETESFLFHPIEVKMFRSRIAPLVALLAISVPVLDSFSPTALAQSAEKVIYAFSDPPGRSGCSGRSPLAPLIADESGNLYGTTIVGGVNEVGCVFKLTRSNSGWRENALYAFSGPDGYYPSAALVFDRLGNLYGTTEFGGDYNSGVVFELTPSSDGTWTETVLHSFGSGSDGYNPLSNLIFDPSGNLYGTTFSSNGIRRGGTVFRLTPGVNGWTETVLYAFPTSYGVDAYAPASGVVMDRQGNLYGTSEGGGANGNGTVYELARSKDGKYRESVIYSFGVLDGQTPMSGLTIDANGSLYGTTALSYSYSDSGIVFRLKKDALGSWTEDVLHQMTGSDGSWPLGPVVFDSLGNLFAAASSGGQYGMGSVFELTPTPSGPWSETVLHMFDYISPGGTDGANPYAGVIIDHGQLFGTTGLGGGPYNAGTVFEITLPAPGAPQ
jgi:uncharacterized repeat protein (TIGR03803 family)